MAEEPDLVVSAGFSDAQLVREANKVVEFYRKKGQEAQKAFVDAQGKVTNTQAARAHARELDKLSKSYDPVYRAAKRYEDELKRLDRALDIGAINQKQYADQVGRAAREMNVASGAIAGATKNFAGGGNAVQQLGWQVGDFATQVGAGTSAIQALGQQLPQMLGAFGTWGALAGAAAAIAVPFGAALFKVATDSETLEDRLKSLNEITDAYAAAAERAAVPIDTLRQRYGGLADEVQRANETMAMLSSIRARTDALGAAHALPGTLGVDLNVQRVSGVNDAEWAAVQASVMDKLREKTGATAEQADRLRMSMNRIGSANSLDAVLRDGESLLDIIAELSSNASADQALFLGGYASQIESVMQSAQAQIRATASEFERVSEQYQTDTEKIKSLSNDRMVAEEALGKAIRDGNAEAVVIWNERLDLIDLETTKTKQLALANDELFQAMQKRLQAGLPGFIDNAVEAATGNTLTQWGKNLEASQKGILDLIKSVESGGDYNATLDNGKYSGGPRDLVNMTINEVLAMQKQMLAHPDNTKNSSAAGAYQIVGKTLQGLKLELNLSGDELFSREMQDRMAQQLIRRRQGQGVDGLRNEWEGLRNVAPAVINQARGQQSIERIDPEVQRAREKEIKDRERIAEQARKYGEQLAQNLLTERESSQLAASQAEQVSGIKAQGLAPDVEARAIAQVTAEIEKQRVVMTLIADAKRREVDLDAMLADGSMTYRQAIVALGEAKAADIVASNDRALAEGRVAEAQELMADAQQQVKSGLLDSILAGESFADVLGNVAKMFARAALEAALFNQGPLAGGGGGLLSGLFSSIFGGGKALSSHADGGPTMPGGKYDVAGIVHAGENVWSQADIRRAGGMARVEALRRSGGLRGYADGGPVIPTVRLPQIQNVTAATRQAGMTATFAPNISIAPGVTQTELAMTMAAARQEYERNFLAMLRQNMPGYNERFS